MILVIRNIKVELLVKNIKKGNKTSYQPLSPSQPLNTMLQGTVTYATSLNQTPLDRTPPNLHFIWQITFSERVLLKMIV